MGELLQLAAARRDRRERREARAGAAPHLDPRGRASRCHRQRTLSRQPPLAATIEFYPRRQTAAALAAAVFAATEPPSSPKPPGSAPPPSPPPSRTPPRQSTAAALPAANHARVRACVRACLRACVLACVRTCQCVPRAFCARSFCVRRVVGRSAEHIARDCDLPTTGQ